MVFSLGGKKETVLVLDIGSGSVGGAIVQMDKVRKSKTKILFSTRADMVYQQQGDRDHAHDSMIRALERVVSALGEVSIGRVDKITCFLAAPWHVSQSRTSTMERKVSFTFSKRFVSAIIDRETLAFQDAMHDTYQRHGDTVRVFEKRLTDVTLDGVSSIAPFGRKTLSVALSLFVAGAPEHLLHRIEYTVNHSFRAPVIFNTFMSGAYMAVRSTLPAYEDFFIVNVGGSMTDIGTSKKNILHTTASLPLGMHAIVRSVAEKSGVTLHEAESLISLTHKKVLTKKYIEHILRIMKDASTTWSRGFKKYFPRSDSPQTVILFCDTKSSSVLVPILEDSVSLGTKIVPFVPEYMSGLIEAPLGHTDIFLSVEASILPFI